jgi:predicted ATPase
MGNLPAQATSFVGRAAELAELRSLVPGGSRLVTIVGPGGIGKSRLALQVAAEALDRADGGVWLVELAPVAEPELVARTAAAVLQVREEPGRPMLDTLVNAVSDRRLLVVLDNAEHVLGAVAKLADVMMRSCPRAWLLVTSREPLGISGERLFRVPSLAVPPAWLLSSRCSYSRSGRRCTGKASPSTPPTPRRWRRSVSAWTGSRWPSSSPRPGWVRSRCRRSAPGSISGSGC